MVFIYLIGFYLTVFVVSNVLNISSFLNSFIFLNYSSLIVIVWIVTILFYLFFTKNSTAWVTDIILYVFGVYRTFLSNFISSFYVVFKNVLIFMTFVKYNLSGIFNFINIQIWTPLYRRGAYLLLLNSSRTRWQLTKSTSLFKNK